MNPIFTELTSWLDDTRQPRLEGWASLEKAEALAMTTLILRPTVAVEIGVFAGRSVLPVALVMREVGHGVIHCIDPYSPQSSAEGYDKTNADWWTNVANHEHAKKQFEGMVEACRLKDIVRVHVCRSDDIEPPATIDLLHVDGQHTLQAVRDVTRYGANVRIGGIVFMDDVGWQNEGRAEVEMAVQKLIEFGFIKLYGVYGNGNDFEVFQRTSK